MNNPEDHIFLFLRHRISKKWTTFSSAVDLSCTDNPKIFILHHYAHLSLPDVLRIIDKNFDVSDPGSTHHEEPPHLLSDDLLFAVTLPHVHLLHLGIQPIQLDIYDRAVVRSNWLERLIGPAFGENNDGF